MDIFFVSILYFAIALLVGLYTFYRGMLSRPTPHIFSAEDRAIVGLASAAVGVLWILFTPIMAVRWALRLYRWADAKRVQLALRIPKEVRLRG